MAGLEHAVGVISEEPAASLAGLGCAGYLGFGSMLDADPAGLVEALIGGARLAGQRMVLHSG